MTIADSRPGPGGQPFPYVVPPEPPDAPTSRPAPVVPTVPDPFSSGPDLDGLLFEQRRVLLTGPLDTDTANRLAGQLMALDGASAKPIELAVNSPGGPLADLFTVLDVLSLLRAPVSTTCFGRAGGTAAFVLAAGTHGRRATPNALVSLRGEGHPPIAGTSARIEAEAEQLRDLRDRAATWLATVSARTAAQILHDMESGTWLDAEAARTQGLVDEVVNRR